ncbi:hypothetical protein P7K49_012535, partial [Saguinus oedipus]
ASSDEPHARIQQRKRHSHAAEDQSQVPEAATDKHSLVEMEEADPANSGFSIDITQALMTQTKHNSWCP